MALLSMSEAASYLGVARRTLNEMCLARVIAFARIGPGRGKYCFRQEWLDAYLESRVVQRDDCGDAQKAGPLLPAAKASMSSNQVNKADGGAVPTVNTQIKKLRDELSEKRSANRKR